MTAKPHQSIGVVSFVSPAAGQPPVARGSRRTLRRRTLRQRADHKTSKSVFSYDNSTISSLCTALVALVTSATSVVVAVASHNKLVEATLNCDVETDSTTPSLPSPSVANTEDNEAIIKAAVLLQPREVFLRMYCFKARKHETIVMAAAKISSTSIFTDKVHGFARGASNVQDVTAAPSENNDTISDVNSTPDTDWEYPTWNGVPRPRVKVDDGRNYSIALDVNQKPLVVTHMPPARSDQRLKPLLSSVPELSADDPPPAELIDLQKRMDEARRIGDKDTLKILAAQAHKIILNEL